MGLGRSDSKYAIVVVALVVAMAGCYGSNGEGSGGSGGPSGTSDTGVMTDAGGDPAACRQACARKLELCESRFDDSFEQECVEECKIAVNAEEAIEETNDAESCFTTGSFTTPREAYCNQSEPDMAGGVDWDVDWSSLGDLESAVSNASDGRIASGPDGTPFVAYKYEPTPSDPFEVAAVQFDGSEWKPLGSPIQRTEGVELLDVRVDKDNTPLMLVSNNDGLDISGVSLLAFESGSWTSIRDIGEVAGARLVLTGDGRPIVVSLVDQKLEATVRGSDGKWKTMTYDKEDVSGQDIAVGNTLGLRNLDAADWPGQDPAVLVASTPPTVFRITSDAVAKVAGHPPAELVSAAQASPHIHVGVAPDGTLYVVAQVTTDEGDEATDGDESHAGYLYKFDGSSWTKATEDDCLDAPNFALGTPSFEAYDPGMVVSVLRDIHFDATGAVVISRYGQASSSARLADDGRFYSWFGGGRLGGQFVQSSFVITRDGTRFLGAAFGDGSKALSLEP